VHQPDPNELAGAVLVRARLERLAGRLAAHTTTKETLRHLERLADAIDRAAETGDDLTYARSQSDFYRTIVEATGNLCLQRAWASVNSFLEIHLSPSPTRPDPDGLTDRRRVGLNGLWDRDPQNAGMIARPAAPPPHNPDRPEAPPSQQCGEHENAAGNRDGGTRE
jgi:DNA-binding GntR family transcriptional regulator